MDALDPSLVVYHCVDDIAAHERIDTASFRAAEARFAARADLVLASAPSARRAPARRSRSNVLYAPNVADTELFAPALQDGPVDAALAALPAPRIVFTGAIAATQAGHGAAGRAGPRCAATWSFALVGPVGPGDPRTDLSALRASRTSTCSARASTSELPDVLRAADAGLIPYARNELTESIFPMKVYEYLAAGLPVVATAAAGARGVAEVAQRARRAGHRATARRGARRATARSDARERSRAPRRTPGSGAWRRSPRRSPEL